MAQIIGEEDKKWEMRKGVFVEELKKEGVIAAPMVAVAVLQYLLQVVSVVMVGHLGQLSLSSVAIATSLTNVVGFSLLGFYLVGLPVGVVLGFVLPLRGKGLWIGIVAGSAMKETLLSLFTSFTN